MYSLETTKREKKVERHVKRNGEPKIRRQGYGKQLWKASAATEGEVSSFSRDLQLNSSHDGLIIVCLAFSH